MTPTVEAIYELEQLEQPGLLKKLKTRRPSCSLCGHDLRPWMTVPIDTRKEAPCDYGHLYRCSACSFGMALPRPAPSMIGAFYQLDSYYTHGESHMAGRGTRTFSDRLRLHLAWRLDFGESLTAGMVHRILGNKSSDICDIGCGAGDFPLELKALGHRIEGIEVDPVAVGLARSRGLTVHTGTAEDLPQAVAGRKFDLVIMRHVMEHLLDPVAAMRTVRDLARPGGLYICVVPNNASLGLASAGETWEALDVPRHLNFFVPENLRTLCLHAGLKPVRLFYGQYCRQFTNEWINTEARIHDSIVRVTGKPRPASCRNTSSKAWKLLLRSALAGKAAKYDEVGIIAKMP
jgi:2-polyprenyl-3-methyl-5-hydroxy-6-metoxy-1,4-benzoquinol methylase